MSCVKAQGFLDKADAEVADHADAKKERKGPAEALALARSAAKLVVARGKKIVTFDMKKEQPDDETLLAHLLGPSGNLRAPTIRKGNTLVVGFSEDAYQEVLYPKKDQE
jgi:arsenate reductase-like glutaredoxin family protein